MRFEMAARLDVGRVPPLVLNSLFASAGESTSAFAGPAAHLLAAPLAYVAQGLPLGSAILGGAVVLAVGATVGARRWASSPFSDGGAPSAGATTAQRATSARAAEAPRSDIGTLVLHWTVAAAMVASLL